MARLFIPIDCFLISFCGRDGLTEVMNHKMEALKLEKKASFPTDLFPLVLIKEMALQESGSNIGLSGFSKNQASAKKYDGLNGVASLIPNIKKIYASHFIKNISDLFPRTFSNAFAFYPEIKLEMIQEHNPASWTILLLHFFDWDLQL